MRLFSRDLSTVLNYQDFFYELLEILHESCGLHTI